MTVTVPPSQIHREDIPPDPKKLLIFGREPAVWVGLIEATLTLVLAFFPGSGLSTQNIALIIAVVTAAAGVYTAWVTKDTMLGVTIGLIKAALALAIGFGLNLGPEQGAAIIALATIVLGLFQRTQTSPLSTP